MARKGVVDNLLHHSETKLSVERLKLVNALTPLLVAFKKVGFIPSLRHIMAILGEMGGGGGGGEAERIGEFHDQNFRIP